MAANSSQGPVSPSGETWECQGLYLADGSVLPTSLGVNPMVTIAAIAHNVSQNVLDALQK